MKKKMEPTRKSENMKKEKKNRLNYHPSKMQSLHYVCFWLGFGLDVRVWFRVWFRC